MYQLRYKIWLDKDGKVFGEGPYQLLKGIDEMGSLSEAAKAIKMSYAQAYDLIKTLERRLGFALVNSKKGGSGGGGSVLTAEAHELMAKYHQFSRDCARALQSAFDKHFG